jgi:hypothetical protein
MSASGDGIKAGSCSMTKRIADQDCSSCGGLLVAPHVSSTVNVPKGADYVCIKCGLPYRRVGHTRLIVMAPRAADDEEDEYSLAERGYLGLVLPMA